MITWDKLHINVISLEIPDREKKVVNQLKKLR